MANDAVGYQLDVDRGPNWLFVKVQPGERSGKSAPQIAEELWSISTKHFIYRLVLELDKFDSMPDGMMSQIVMLQERLAQHGGSLKLCGLSPECEQKIHHYRLDSALPNHESRTAAVLGESAMMKCHVAAQAS
jgi:anti-anti-sigma regulatory factor